MCLHRRYNFRTHFFKFRTNVPFWKGLAMFIAHKNLIVIYSCFWGFLLKFLFLESQEVLTKKIHLDLILYSRTNFTEDLSSLICLIFIWVTNVFRLVTIRILSKVNLYIIFTLLDITFWFQFSLIRYFAKMNYINSLHAVVRSHLNHLTLVKVVAGWSEFRCFWFI